MSATTGIEWTDATWNPVTGCTKVSPGCDHCYAETFAERFRGVEGHYFERGFDVQLREDKLTLPLRWRKPRRVFIDSMSDLFHKDVPDEYIARVFVIMALTPQHTYQVLTKRHGRMRSLLSWSSRWRELLREADSWACGLDVSWPAERFLAVRRWIYGTGVEIDPVAPLPNVWLGVSVENQRWADLRIPALLKTPAAVRFLSCEPLLGPVDLNGPADAHGHRARLTYWLTGRPGWAEPETTTTGVKLQAMTTGPRIDWVIVGGESGRGARPMHPDWARSLRDQCTAAGVPYLFKQWGEWAPESVCATERGAKSALYIERNGLTRPAARGARGEAVTVQRNGKHRTGRRLDGRTWDQYPTDPQESAK